MALDVPKMPFGTRGQVRLCKALEWIWEQLLQMSSELGTENSKVLLLGKEVLTMVPVEKLVVAAPCSHLDLPSAICILVTQHLKHVWADRGRTLIPAAF